MTFDRDSIYRIEGDCLLTLREAMLRLFTEDHLSGDEMRDMAERMRLVLERAVKEE